MTKQSKQNITCPTCGKKDTWQSDNAYRPFCSERCRLIDLGEWAKENYRIKNEDKTNTNSEDSN